MPKKHSFEPMNEFQGVVNDASWLSLYTTLDVPFFSHHQHALFVVVVVKLWQNSMLFLTSSCWDSNANMCLTLVCLPQCVFDIPSSWSTAWTKRSFSRSKNSQRGEKEWLYYEDEGAAGPHANYRLGEQELGCRAHTRGQCSGSPSLPSPAGLSPTASAWEARGDPWLLPSRMSSYPARAS